MKVCIDAGHSGADPGALGLTGSKESDVNLSIAQLLRNRLVFAGHEVVMTRTRAREPESDSLRHRVEQCNAALCECFVSIHCNAAATPLAHGFEVYYFNGSQAGNALAGRINAALDKRIPLYNRGVKPANFQVLRETVCPAVLIECGFITNADDERYLLLPTNQAHIAQAVCEALCAA